MLKELLETASQQRESQLARCREMLAAVPESERVNRWYFSNPRIRQSVTPNYYYAGGLFLYRDSPDLTAAILELFIGGHPVGDVPRFSLSDAKHQAGELWDTATAVQIVGY